MKGTNKINRFRRRSMHLITRSIGKPETNRTTVSIVKDEIKTILITRPNHRLGNQLMITSLLQEVTEVFPNCKIDLFVKGRLAPILFKNYKNIDKIIQFRANSYFYF